MLVHVTQSPQSSFWTRGSGSDPESILMWSKGKMDPGLRQDGGVGPRDSVAAVVILDPRERRWSRIHLERPVKCKKDPGLRQDDR
jgi:hypothetical protein